MANSFNILSPSYLNYNLLIFKKRIIEMLNYYSYAIYNLG